MKFVHLLRMCRLEPALNISACRSKQALIHNKRFYSSTASVPFLHEAAFINGQLVPAHNPERSECCSEPFVVVNPYDDEPIGVVPDLGPEDAEKAIEAAHSAFLTWRETTAKERSQLLKNWYHLLTKHSEDLAKLLTLEQGKPLTESRGEMAYASSFIEWFAEEGRRTYGDIVPSPVPTRRILHFKQPVGVCALITPWNFPVAMITRKAGAALAAGCTVVVKPAEDTPYSAVALAVLAKEAGIPPGVFNVVTSSRERTPAVGHMLCKHPLVQKISFTGSTIVGKQLMRQCADGVKKISLELGGNAPFIVFESADLDAAVAGAMGSKFRNGGQTCVCANRFFVHESVVNTFVAKLGAAMGNVRLGNGFDDHVSQGPLINRKAVDKVNQLVTDAIKHGATVLRGGEISEEGSNFYQPTLITGVDHGMAVVNSEIFGPVASVMKFHSEDEVLALANSTPYGLAAYFYSRDLTQIWRVASRLDFGSVGVNEGVISAAEANFGGFKESGIGRESSKYGIDEYLDVKHVSLGGMNGGVC